MLELVEQYPDTNQLAAAYNIDGVPALGIGGLYITSPEMARNGERLPADVSGQRAVAIANQYLRFGSSPRGGQTLILAGKVRALTQGRFNVSFEDIQAAAPAALRHRLILNFEAEAEGITTDHIIAQVLKDVPRNVEAVKV